MTRFTNPRYQAFDDKGLTVPNGRLYFFAQGTTDKLDTFQDELMTVVNENPVTPDGMDGVMPDIYLQPLDYTVRYTRFVDGEEKDVWDADVSGVTIPEATELISGIVRLANPAEMSMGTSDSIVPSVQTVTNFIELDAARISSGTLASDRLPAATDTAIGAVEAATQAETDAGTADVYPDAEKIKTLIDATVGALGGNVVSFNGSSTGHIEFQNGFKINWGTGTVGANSSTTATYDSAFTMFSIPVVSGGTGMTTNDPGATASSATTTDFSVTNSIGSLITFYYVAVGV